MREPEELILQADLVAFTTQLQQLTEQLHQLQQVVAQLSDRPNSPQPDPQIRAALQPVHTRLQQMDAQVGVIGNLVQQIVQQIIKHQLRLEGWLEAMYVILQPRSSWTINPKRCSRVVKPGLKSFNSD
ncbi:hypothetical protein H6F89_26490 [Cyanobacteria bacterium FACHB-63]|nr:hypothetical protein [Cyanobacteria bacterium FACHB-63]